MTGDYRIALKDAADLVGIAYGTLRNLIARGEGPPRYNLGTKGQKQTVRIIELARWVESKNVE